MNRRAMIIKRNRRLFPFAAAAAALLLAGCGSHTKEQPPLAGAAIGGPFTLTDSAGKEVHWSDFKGKYRIVYFGYTYCPDVCPTEVQRIMKGYAIFKQDNPELAKRIQPIFISVDPERDTPAKVGEFTHAFSDDLIGLTGTPAQVASAAKAFGVYYQKAEASKGGGYMVDHSNAAYLMDPDGGPIALLPLDQGANAPQAIAAELERWTN